MRAPMSRVDLEARVAALRHRADSRKTPVLDVSGMLHYDGRSVSISTTQTELMELFVERFEGVVHRHELRQRLTRSAVPNPSRNALDLHIMRLRRRLSPAGLAIRTAWGRGYVLEPLEPAPQPERFPAEGEACPPRPPVPARSPARTPGPATSLG
ncbi:helix-turn-helix domain-containing protein [Streptomyces sp. LP05-1]|uniref:Helix-turn-helix domain-containing protein n=1 Tax=Streptomyces pyxinae TaxID=2970734 RepID=A0ABT2CPQ2_9ACTN|nr:helix-turn-helix domain-containing protein [Streptomyces sp. LP05-1]MCS0639062.1 helix-turn-helix domain-containing protein [Streptomyces sp. LP05-1]